jgi:cysteine desulfurase
MIYLDHNATTPLDERVLEAMMPYLASFYGNPSSLHRLGRLSRSAVEMAREQVAALVGAHPSEVIFTSGGTESNNLALKGLSRLFTGGAIAVGATEHSSVLEVVDALQLDGWRLEVLGVDANGRIDPRCIADLPAEDLRFATVMLANNETGVIQDIAALADAFDRRDVVLHCDAVQAAGKIPVDFKRLGARLMSLSAHKLYGPKGAGALICDRSIPLKALMHGGGQERGLRGGTEHVAALVGFGKAAELALAEMEARRDHVLALRRRLETALAALPGISLFALRAERVPNTVQIGVAGIDGEMLVMALDRQGIAVSSGSACASGGNEPSHVLTAMGIDAVAAKSAIRVSLGSSNTDAEIDRFVAALKNLLEAPYPLSQASNQ